MSKMLKLTPRFVRLSLTTQTISTINVPAYKITICLSIHQQSFRFRVPLTLIGAAARVGGICSDVDIRIGQRPACIHCLLGPCSAAAKMSILSPHLQLYL